MPAPPVPMSNGNPATTADAVSAPFPRAALEELTAGVQAHARLQTALQQLYAAAHAVRVQRIHEGTVDAPSKKTLATAEEERYHDAMTQAARKLAAIYTTAGTAAVTPPPVCP